MTDIGYYMDLPYDLSGSMAKNRFRYELLWGLKKMLALFDDKKKFIVVFDYVCDVEIHLDTHFEFYQLKTQNKNGSYTINKLIKIEKDKTKSILGNLYRLKYDKNLIENKDTHVYIVSNAPLKDDKKLHTDCEIINLNNIDEKSKDKIISHIRTEINISGEIDLNKSYFIRTNMNLLDPKAEIIGELTILLEKNPKCRCKSVTALYNVLFSEVSNRACYEVKIDDYNEIVKNKGFTDKQLEHIINQYIEDSDDSIEKTKKFIDSNYTIGRKIKLKTALKNVVFGLKGNRTLKNIEVDVIENINQNKDILDNSEDVIINIIKDNIYHRKTIEISEDEIEVLILLTLKKYEEGVYE